MQDSSNRGKSGATTYQFPRVCTTTRSMSRAANARTDFRHKTFTPDSASPGPTGGFSPRRACAGCCCMHHAPESIRQRYVRTFCVSLEERCSTAVSQLVMVHVLVSTQSCEGGKPHRKKGCTLGRLLCTIVLYETYVCMWNLSFILYTYVCRCVVLPSFGPRQVVYRRGAGC